MLSSVKLLSSNLSSNVVSRWVCQQTKRGPNCFTRVLGLVWAMREAKSLKLHRMSSMVNGRRAAQTGGLTSITQLPIRFKIFCVRISFPKFALGCDQSASLHPRWDGGGGGERKERLQDLVQDNPPSQAADHVQVCQDNEAKQYWWILSPDTSSWSRTTWKRLPSWSPLSRGRPWPTLRAMSWGGCRKIHKWHPERIVSMNIAGCGEPVRQHLADARGDPDRHQQGHGPHQLQSPPRCLRWDRALQLPRHDPSVDVPDRWYWANYSNDGD